MHIGWNRIWKVLLGCACVIGSIALLACGQGGGGSAALEAAVLLLALQYAPRAARLRKTWWFVELVLVLAVTVGYAGFAAVRAAQTPASAVVITTERSVPPVTPVPETAAPELTATPEPTPAPPDARLPGGRLRLFARSGPRFDPQGMKIRIPTGSCRAEPMRWG